MNKKRIIAAFLSCMFVILSSLQSIAAAAYVPASGILVNGSYVQSEQQSVVENGVLLLPLRNLFEALGAEIAWDSQSQTVAAVKDDTNISIQIGKALITVDGQVAPLDVPPKLVNGRTLISSDAIEKVFNVKVEWHDAINTASIITRSESTTRDIVEGLSKPEYRGRLVGSAGNEAAEAFLRNEFASAGLIPFLKDTYGWEYTQTVYDPDKSDPKLMVRFKDGTERELVFGVDFDMNVALPDIDVEYPVTFDPADPDITERVYIWQDSENTYNIPALTISPIDSFYIGHWVTLPPEFTELKVNMLDSVFKEIRWNEVLSVSFSINNSGVDKKVRNLAGFLPGRDRTKAVIVTSHYDGAGYSGDYATDGAVDNASGVAAMLRAAKIINEWNEPPETDVVFVAFNGEETGLLGSKAFVSELLSLGNYKSLYNLNLDCVSTSVLFSLNLHPSGWNYSLYAAMAEIMDEMDIEYTDVYVTLSDSTSFDNRGIPNVVIMNLYDGVAPTIHSPNDTIKSPALDYDILNKSADLAAEFIRRTGLDFPDMQPDGFSGSSVLGMPRHLLYAYAEKLRKEIPLAFDEFYSFQYGGITFAFSSGVPVSYEEYKEFFPGAGIKEELMNYALDGIDLNIGDKWFSNVVIYQGEPNEKGEVDFGGEKFGIKLRYANNENPGKNMTITVSGANYSGDLEKALSLTCVSGNYWLVEREKDLFNLFYFDREFYIDVGFMEDGAPISVSVDEARELAKKLDFGGDTEYLRDILR